MLNSRSRKEARVSLGISLCHAEAAMSLDSASFGRESLGTRNVIPVHVRSE